MQLVELPTSNRALVAPLLEAAKRCLDDRRYASSYTLLRRALALEPGDAAIWGTLGCTLFNMGERGAALEPMVKATVIDPACADHWGNLGLLHSSQLQWDEAERAYARCLELKPDHLGARWDRSLARLKQGQWEQGFPDYETRIIIKAGPLYPKFPVPLWQGEPLDGKTLYVQPEQGIGDRILFLRWLPVVKRLWPGCRIVFCCAEDMVSLLWGYREVVEFLPHSVPWPDGIDYGTFLVSLPHLTKVYPDAVGPDPGYINDRVRRQHAQGGFALPQPRREGSLKIGIAWTGNPAQARNADRSIPLELLLPLAEDPQVTLYSFQVGPGAGQIARLGCGDLVYDLEPALAKAGLVGAGVAMLEMDLIITVCTATAHLAGALGVPCWLLLCQDCYWVWGTPGSTNYLYPSIEFYRQERQGEWVPVLLWIQRALEEWKETHRTIALQPRRAGAPT